MMMMFPLVLAFGFRRVELLKKRPIHVNVRRFARHVLNKMQMSLI